MTVDIAPTPTGAGEAMASRAEGGGDVLASLSEAFAAPQKGVVRAFGIVFNAMQEQAKELAELRARLEAAEEKTRSNNQMEDERVSRLESEVGRLLGLEARLNKMPSAVHQLSVAVLASEPDLAQDISVSAGPAVPRRLSSPVAAPSPRRSSDVLVLDHQQQQQDQPEAPAPVPPEPEEEPASFSSFPATPVPLQKAGLEEDDEGSTGSLAVPLPESIRVVVESASRPTSRPSSSHNSRRPLSAQAGARTPVSLSAPASRMNLEEMLTVMRIDVARALGLEMRLEEGFAEMEARLAENTWTCQSVRDQQLELSEAIQELRESLGGLGNTEQKQWRRLSLLDQRVADLLDQQTMMHNTAASEEPPKTAPEGLAVAGLRGELARLADTVARLEKRAEADDEEGRKKLSEGLSKGQEELRAALEEVDDKLLRLGSQMESAMSTTRSSLGDRVKAIEETLCESFLDGGKSAGSRALLLAPMDLLETDKFTARIQAIVKQQNDGVLSKEATSKLINDSIKDVLSLLDGLETNVAGLLPYVEKRLQENEAHLDSSLSAKALANLANLGLIMKDDSGDKWVRVPGKYDDEAALMALLITHVEPAVRSALEPELRRQAEVAAELRAALAAMQDQAKDLHGSLGKIEDKINTRTTPSEVEMLIRARVTDMQDRLQNCRTVLEQQVEVLSQSKMDKTAVQHVVYNLEQNILARIKREVEAAKMHADGLVSGQRLKLEDLAYVVKDLDENMHGLQARVEGMPPAVTRDELLRETESRERSIRDALERQMSRLGVQVDDLTKLTGKLDTVPTETQVRDMFSKLDSAVRSAVGGSEATAAMLHSLKQEVKKKTTREDVLSLVLHRLEQMAEMLKIPEDGLMVGKLQYRCLACNGPTSKLHDCLAEKMVHDALSPIPATLPPDERKRQYQHLILATYPHGRGGALKPLQPTYAPHDPTLVSSANSNNNNLPPSPPSPATNTPPISQPAVGLGVSPKRPGTVGAAPPKKINNN